MEARVDGALYPPNGGPLNAQAAHASGKIAAFHSGLAAVKFLAFDTATEWCSAALWVDGLCTHAEIHAGQKHSDLLVPMLMKLLAESGFTLRQMDALVYGMGPGSFTGLRIACGVAQGLALGADLPVLGISTLETLAEASAAEEGVGVSSEEVPEKVPEDVPHKVLACLDARMNEVYVALYQRENVPHDSPVWRCLTGPLVCPPAAVPLPAVAGFIGVGSGFAAYPHIAEACRLSRVDGGLIPHARAMARLAVPRLRRGEGMPAEHAEPLYIRDKVALKICERGLG